MPAYPSFTIILLPPNAFKHQAIRQQGVLLPPTHVLPHPLIVDMWIAALFHT